MAAKTKVSSVEKMSNAILIDPADVVADQVNNTRKPSASAIGEMADSLKREGQKQPVMVRKGDDGAYRLVFGFTRHAAMLRHNEKNPEQPMKLAAVVAPEGMTDAQAFAASAVENNDRTNPDAIQVAAAQRKLMEEFGLSAQDVAALYGWRGRKAEQVGQLQKLLALPADIRKMVSQRELPVIAAIDLTDVPEEEQRDILASADRKASGKIKGESVRKAVKRKTGKPERTTRSSKEIGAFFASLTGSGEDKAVRKLATTLEAFCNGEVEQTKAERVFLTLGGALSLTKKAAEAETHTPADDGEPQPEVIEVLEDEAPKRKVGKNRKPRKAKGGNADAAPETEETETEVIEEEVHV